MSNSRSGHHSSAGPFSLCIEGLPDSYTWKDVKDLARNRAGHGIRSDGGYKTNDRGYRFRVHVVKVSRKDEAHGLYRFLIENLIEGRFLTVHFFENLTLIQSNCNRSDPACQVCHDAAKRATAGLPFDFPSGYYTSGPSIPAMAPAAYSHPASAMIPVDGHIQFQYMSSPPATMPAPADRARMDVGNPQSKAEFIAKHLRELKAAGKPLKPDQEELLRRVDNMRLQNHQVKLAPVYVTNVTGPPVNTVHGVARTETRGVFVQGLNFKTKSKDIEKLFGKAGTIVNCDIHLDNKGKAKGSATIEYTTTDEALTAVKSLDGFRWQGRMLRVRTDREPVVISPPPSNAASSSTQHDEQSGPIIVNGSNIRKAANK